MAKFYKISKCVFSWPAQLKNGQIFQIGHEIANVATLLLFGPVWIPWQAHARFFPLPSVSRGKK